MMRDLLHAAFRTGVAASHPRSLLLNSAIVDRLKSMPPDQCVRVVAAGKAASTMAKTLEEIWPLRSPPTGVAVVPYGFEEPTVHIETIAAAHPYPDEKSILAAQQVARVASACEPSDVLVVLISGGGSSVLSWPVSGVSLKDFDQALRGLMAAGADISALNTVRKHLSRLAGGKLARLAIKAKIEAFVLSDVVGDDPSLIASGPVFADDTSLLDAQKIFTDHGVQPAPSILTALADRANETPSEGDDVFSKVQAEVVSSSVWISPVSEMLENAGLAVKVLGAQIEGDVADVAQQHAQAAIDAAQSGRPIALLSGGEVTTRLRGKGEGGPNAEFCLELARALEGHPKIWALACDTDGIDGGSNAAGGLITPDTLSRAVGLDYPVEDALKNSDSTGLLKRLGDAVVCGPTMTNVNDLRVILINTPT